MRFRANSTTPHRRGAAEKLMLHGIEVHQSDEAGCLGDPDEPAVCREVKELVRAQVYPTLSQRPYDDCWTVPYQMGVEVHAVTTPLTKQVRDCCSPSRKIKGWPHRSTTEPTPASALSTRFWPKGTVSFAGMISARRGSIEQAG